MLAQLARRLLEVNFRVGLALGHAIVLVGRRAGRGTTLHVVVLVLRRAGALVGTLVGALVGTLVGALARTLVGALARTLVGALARTLVLTLVGVRAALLVILTVVIVVAVHVVGFGLRRRAIRFLNLHTGEMGVANGLVQLLFDLGLVDSSNAGARHTVGHFLGALAVEATRLAFAHECDLQVGSLVGTCGK